jgi:haloacid dehalogenase superfamily, subfamily IA, variant 3 with third motif having DD or ED/haloacid dehalogenase superfamily, subfamily IA, variant 1 with third motif having Dx(3-4)D or Dx(3-4)E
MKDTVIFDLDGTLLDTLEDLADAVNHELERFGRPLRTIDQIRKSVGNGIGNLIGRSLEKGKEDPDFEAILADFAEYYTANCRMKTRPYPDIAAMLEKLKEKGIKTGVVSNKNDASVQKLVKYYFGDLIMTSTGECRGVRRKPAPDTITAALEKLGSRKEDAYYVGDSEVDIQAADNAGLEVIIVSWGFRGRERMTDYCRENGREVPAIIDDPDEIIGILGNH